MVKRSGAVAITVASLLNMMTSGCGQPSEILDAGADLQSPVADAAVCDAAAADLARADGSDQDALSASDMAVLDMAPPPPDLAEIQDATVPPDMSGDLAAPVVYPTTVFNLTAAPAPSAVSLNWSNPANPSFHRVRIQRRPDAFPSGPFDGTNVYEGDGTSCTDSSLTGGLYYYGVWTYDAAALLDVTGQYVAADLSSASRWQISIVGSGPSKSFSDFYPRAVALDSVGRPLVVYGEDGLFLARRDSEWSVETIDTSPGVGRFASLAVRDDKLHVAYYDATASILRYATDASGGWRRYSVGAIAGSGQYSSIAVDHQGRIHISFYADPDESTRGRLYYAVGNAGTWDVTLIEEGQFAGDQVGEYSAIALDSNDHAHVSYYGYGDAVSNFSLRYANNIAGPWSTPVAVAGSYWVQAGKYGSMVIGSDDSIHISYGFKDVEQSLYGLAYAVKPAGGGWAVARVDDTLTEEAQYTSIALDNQNRPRVAYHDGDGADLKYASFNGTSWSAGVLESAGNVGVYSSLATNRASGAEHLTYLDGTNQELRYLARTDGIWGSSETVDCKGSASGDDVGWYASIAIDGSQSDAVHVAYYDYTNGAIKHARLDGVSWTIETVDPAVGTFDNDTNANSLAQLGYTSIAVKNGVVHIAYYDANSPPAGEALHYATNKTGAWVTEVVDNDGEVGKWASIGIDGNDNLHIAYYSNKYQHAYYATRHIDAVPWSVTQLTTAGATNGWYNSLAIAADNTLYVGHLYKCNDALALATKPVSGAWSDGLVEDTGGMVGYNTSIALDTSGNVHLAHYKYDSPYAVRYATNVTGSWVNRNVDSLQSEGKTGIGVDGSGNVIICYRDKFFVRLRCAWKAAGSDTFTTETVDDSGSTGRYPSIAIDSQGRVHVAYYDFTLGKLKHALAPSIVP